MRTLERIMIAAAVLTLAATGGCLSRAAKEGIGVATGAKGSYQVLGEEPAGGQLALASYANFDLGSFSDATEGRAPREIWDFLPMEFQKELLAKKLPQRTGGKTLIARGKVIYYEDSKLTGNIFGPLEEVVARVEFVDKSSGRVVGQALCVGRTGETVNLGVRKKAEGLAKALVKWIADHYPKQEE